MPPQGQPSRLRADALMRLERRFFSDWLGWLCSDWNGPANKAKFEACMEAVERELQASGVRAVGGVVGLRRVCVGGGEGERCVEAVERELLASGVSWVFGERRATGREGRRPVGRAWWGGRVEESASG